jgi:hypothetical protein
MNYSGTAVYKSEIRISKSETNWNYQNWSFGLPTPWAGPQFQMTETSDNSLGGVGF